MVLTYPFYPYVDPYVQVIFALTVMAIMIWLFFLPVFFARKQRKLIFVLCLFTGWTVIGWITAMVLAYVDRRDVVARTL